MADGGDCRDRSISASLSGPALRQRSVLRDLLSCARPGNADVWAERLLNEYGTLYAVIRGPARRTLPFLNGCYDALDLLQTMHACHLEMLRGEVEEREPLTGEDAVQYLTAAIGHEETEVVWALFLDHRYRLIKSEALFRGGFDSCNIEVGMIMRRALELEARALLLAHNHPSGDCTPSHADKILTSQIARAGKDLSVTLVDHLIISAESFTSFRRELLL
ncbi:JAB domain-containing protein [Sphingomonas immobilis]|uniref:JAB domain-containing protein n=1 Tax=Sphingomonas immobilis TaxID=3063997 RepID=A0ABT8ZW81_9SPHN|nr:JAB domain-containing protein [Sphingomonas sp. CA1-15]MDO7841831.1 JAB domain-containing protein [Sphingomonas sp. CA1-15]